MSEDDAARVIGLLEEIRDQQRQHFQAYESNLSLYRAVNHDAKKLIRQDRITRIVMLVILFVVTTGIIIFGWFIK